MNEGTPVDDDDDWEEWIRISCIPFHIPLLVATIDDIFIVVRECTLYQSRVGVFWALLSLIFSAGSIVSISPLFVVLLLFLSWPHTVTIWILPCRVVPDGWCGVRVHEIRCHPATTSILVGVSFLVRRVRICCLWGGGWGVMSNHHPYYYYYYQWNKTVWVNRPYDVHKLLLLLLFSPMACATAGQPASQPASHHQQQQQQQQQQQRVPMRVFLVVVGIVVWQHTIDDWIETLRFLFVVTRECLILVVLGGTVLLLDHVFPMLRTGRLLLQDVIFVIHSFLPKRLHQ